jgi:hypothetical protein
MALNYRRVIQSEVGDHSTVCEGRLPASAGPSISYTLTPKMCAAYRWSSTSKPKPKAKRGRKAIGQAFDKHGSRLPAILGTTG